MSHKAKQPPNPSDLPVIQESANAVDGHWTLSFGAYTEQGGRLRNEDNFCIFDDFACVSDGIGGAEHGDVMSKLACSIMRDEWEALAKDDLDAESRMREAFAKTDAFLTKVSQGLGGGPGATLVATARMGDQLIFGSVGDSRAYVFLDTGLSPVFEESGRVYEDGNTLSAAMGYNMFSGDKSAANILTIPVAAGLKLLLCTDGVWSVLAKADMEDVINDGDLSWPIARQLVGRAVTNGGLGGDNATALVGVITREAWEVNPEKTPLAPSCEPPFEIMEDRLWTIE